MLKNLHPDFKSDIFILFETIGAQLTIRKFLLRTTQNTMGSIVFVAYLFINNFIYQMTFIFKT